MKLNLDYYNGKDLYSDGEVEDKLLHITKNHKSFHNVLKENSSWPILYHLSPIRSNLLEWYPFNERASLLEIGAGCGAITGLLSEKVNKVTAIELSKKRAEILANRYEDRENIEVIVGNFEDIPFDRKFDYITLIGVLEYSGKYGEGSSPYFDFLKKAKSMLSPNGTLIIAIENKYGLKYWAGATEDHTGQWFDGIEHYVGNDEVRTFSKKEIEELLKKAGFFNNDFYYPMPDYKLPSQVFSDSYLPKPGDLKITPNFDRDRLLLFNEKITFDNIIQNEMFPFFSNSFLIFSKE
ncbi:class I SAM-dependent methyltransferase [Paenibacillus sp. BGI2013]|uniref:class I SAM-dependent methyltransferase n=1 Tax=Paenibacillus TaxID=44249 RepID=UPI00096C1001|nr:MULTISPECIES: class I SAM-dependent methyltransferase [Paenibacillus]OMF39711.1 SAM-dependent methyltransferase [Paenibacillus amylolyticus]PKQ92470.1 class I SAM-dependent methyltransferase [Paenibacillus sp. BGI2013]